MKLVAALAILMLAAGAAVASPGFDGGVTPDGNGLVVNPTSMSIGTTGPGMPISQGFTLTNTESILSISVSGTYKPGSQCGSFTLTPPSTLPILMAPMQLDSWTASFSASAPGSYYCHVEIQDTDANVDFIDLYATVAAPMMSTSPTGLDFGSVLVGDVAYRSFYVTNNGNATLTVSSLTKTGDPEFTIYMSPSPPFTVSPFGGSQSVIVRYAPLASGGHAGQIQVTGNDPVNASDSVSFSGNGNASGTGAYLHMSPDPVAFGNVAVGASDTAAVSWSATGVGTVHVSHLEIVGPGATSYTIESDGCAGVQGCDVDLDVTVSGTDLSPTVVRCAPTSVGLKGASLVATSDANNNPVSVALSCTGTGPDISIKPSTLDFGTVRLGQTVTLPITIDNNGNTTLTYSFLFTGVSDYNAGGACTSSCTLGPGMTSIQNLTFDPTVIGARNASLMVMSDDPLELVTTIGLSGVGGGGVLAIVQPASSTVEFGMIPQGVQSTPQSIQVRNDGNLNLKLSGVMLSSTTAFAIQGTLPPPDVILLPNQSHTITATCEPPGTSDYLGFVRYMSDAPIGPMRDVALTCTGIDTDLVATPAPITFAPTRVGDSDVVHVSIENVGAAMSITAMAATPSVFTITNAESLPISIGAGDTTELDLRFTPTADGDVPGTLTVTGSSGDPLLVTLLGPGRVAAFTVQPSSYDFGAVCVGTQSVKRFSVTSTGSADFEIEAPALVDPDVAFDLAMIDPDESEFPATIAPSGTVTVDVTAAPTSASAVGTLKFATDVDPDGDVDVTLQIVAITSGVGVGPAAVDFGPVPVDGVSTPQEISLANCDVAPLAVSSVRVIGDDAGAFAVGGTLPPPNLIVPVSGNVRWTVVFRPDHEGAHSASLEIMHALGTTLVPLDGLGDVPDPDAGPTGNPDGGAGFDTTSYYACTCRGSGGATGAAPLLLVVVLGLVRRRRRQQP